jgi:hypothetical protein
MIFTLHFDCLASLKSDALFLVKNTNFSDRARISYSAAGFCGRNNTGYFIMRQYFTGLEDRYAKDIYQKGAFYFNHSRNDLSFISGEDHRGNLWCVRLYRKR